jgi:hypothetical protein
MLPEPQQSKLECLTTAVRNATQVDWSKGNSIIGFNIWGIQIHKSRYHIISLHWHHESNHKSINGTELCRKANICEIMKIWSSNYYHMIQQNSKLRLHKSPKVSNLSWRIQQICIGYMVHFFLHQFWPHHERSLPIQTITRQCPPGSPPVLPRYRPTPLTICRNQRQNTQIATGTPKTPWNQAISLQFPAQHAS